MRAAGRNDDLLVADIGGTNSRFGIAGDNPGPLQLHAVARLINAGVADFAAQLSRYAQALEVPLPRRACIAVAGPTDGEHAMLTNGDWRFERGALIAEFGFEDVLLVNDFTALASAVSGLGASQQQLIKKGTPQAGAPVCVIGPGTGLGVACVIACASQHTVIATEGGHVDLAPVTSEEWALKQWLAGQLGRRVSAEDVLCGEGLRRIDAFQRGGPDAPRNVDTITAEAIRDPSSQGRQAVDQFLRLLARFAGNTALSQGARGGVFMGGGILPRLLPILDTTQFARDFSDKGVMAGYCEALPVHVITDTEAPLGGAAVAYSRARQSAGA